MRKQRWWIVGGGVVVFLIGITVGARLTASNRALAEPLGIQDSTAATVDAGAKGQPVDTHLFRNIARQQNPVVVFITTESKVTPEMPSYMNDDFFRQFFGIQPTPPHAEVRRALGSGFIISADGEILTNNHVVGDADRIRVALFSDETKRYDAHVVGRDPLTDTALIRVDDAAGTLPTATLGDSDALQPGDWVMAIGNPFNLGHTVTVGVVSYLGRPFLTTEGRYQKMIQTDASINPGNSGGPLIDTNGRVVGINSAILGGDEGGNIGIGFAVPINAAKALLPQLRSGKVVRGYLGVRVSPVTDDEARALKLPSAEGAMVRQVEDGSPAAKASIAPGDVIVQYQGRPVHTPDDLVSAVSATAPDTRAAVVVIRNGARVNLSVTVEELQTGVNARGHGSSTADVGLTLSDLTPDLAQRLGLEPGTRGAVIEDVRPGSAADTAGLRPYDVILEVNRQTVRSAAAATQALGNLDDESVVFLLISRGGTRVFVSMRRQ